MHNWNLVLAARVGTHHGAPAAGNLRSAHAGGSSGCGRWWTAPSIGSRPRPLARSRLGFPARTARWVPTRSAGSGAMEGVAGGSSESLRRHLLLSPCREPTLPTKATQRSGTPAWLWSAFPACSMGLGFYKTMTIVLLAAGYCGSRIDASFNDQSASSAKAGFCLAGGFDAAAGTHNRGGGHHGDY